MGDLNPSTANAAELKGYWLKKKNKMLRSNYWKKYKFVFSPIRKAELQLFFFYNIKSYKFTFLNITV